MFSDTWTQGVEWISPNLYFLFSSTDGGDCPLYGFEYINVETGKSKHLWQEKAISFALDPEKKLLAVSNECKKPGTFLVDWDGKYKKISDIPLSLKFWGGEVFRFLGSDFWQKQAWGIDQDGSMTLLSNNYFTAASTSPDNHWFVLYKDYYISASTVIGMDLFSESNQFLRRITDQYAYPVAWSPDSTGLFYISSGLYYVTIPDGQPLLIDDCKPNRCEDSFIWLP